MLRNRHLVFGASGTPCGRSVRRYALLAAAVLAANLVVMEVLTEAGLFIASYPVQSRVVFASPVSVLGPERTSTTATSAALVPALTQGQRGRDSRRLQ